MTHITTRLAALGLGLALGLPALPLVAGAESTATFPSAYANHRFYFSEEMVWLTLDEATAEYAMLEVSELERIAGRTKLDAETIKFLEDNLWERDLNAQPAGEADEMTPLERIAGRRHLDTETIQFLEDNLWEYDAIAAFAGEASPNDVPEEALWFAEDEAQNPTVGDTGIGVYDVDPDDYSNEIPWQDLVEPYAGFAGNETNDSVVEQLPPALTP
jgi:hypothetical protein